VPERVRLSYLKDRMPPQDAALDGGCDGACDNHSGEHRLIQVADDFFQRKGHGGNRGIEGGSP
jgi:hypothetical protein